jgi:hypothetical protein
MANFEPRPNRTSAFLACAVGLLVLCAYPPHANAQQQTLGYAVERFYPSAPGAGWFVMDDLNISGGFGGAISLTSGYARNPLVVTNPDGSQNLAVVSNEAFVDVGIAATYHRYRVYLNLPVPLAVTGNSGTLAGTTGPYQLNAPSVSAGTNPDTVSDTRLGFDMRLAGKPGDALRIGAGAQLLVPSGARSDYVTDGRYRAMFRLLAAGDVGRFLYAGQFGLHVRPVEGSLPPGGPNGNEFLFGASVGRRFSVRKDWDTVVGPEFFGESVVHSNYRGQTGFEGLLTGRLERKGDKPHLRFKLGVGHGLVQNFGAPEWRVLVAVELVSRP